ncbi:SRPBCC family protein [Sphaerimonospora thailandensis]|uniref:SRPBCC family protein n=1 Tax=Sphaerimonospora thailandensis TaxID=795644 RepID=UPI001950DBE9|nr:SRPBCC family protein [Sphaerimonospora thailandensis]
MADRPGHGRHDGQVTVIERGASLSRTAGAAGLGACAGALTEYLLDPNLGRTRRARVRDKAVHGVHRSRGWLGVLARDFTNRSRGAVAEIRYRFVGRNVDDRVLSERVRAELGRHVSHPHAVEVHVAGGRVTLAGHVLEREDRRARRAVARIPGVKDVEASWTAHHDAEGVIQLQGGGRPRERVPEIFQQCWSPTARFLAGAAAAATWAMSGRLPGPFAWMVRAGCAVLGARAATNLPLKRLSGIGAGRRAVDIEDAISVAAPAEDVWPLLSDYSVFAKCMPDVLEVRRSDDGRRSHWVISGPAGVPIGFEAAETSREEGREISWRTTEGRLIAHTGTLRLTPEGADHCRIEVRLAYNPVVGAVGHAMATLLGADPARKLQQDLMRLKSLIETGKPLAGAVSGEDRRS